MTIRRGTFVRTHDGACRRLDSVKKLVNPVHSTVPLLFEAGYLLAHLLPAGNPSQSARRKPEQAGQQDSINRLSAYRLLWQRLELAVISVSGAARAVLDQQKSSGDKVSMLSPRNLYIEGLAKHLTLLFTPSAPIRRS